MMAEQWYIARQGERYGPFSWEQVAYNYREGKIKNDDLLWSESTVDWIRADQLQALSGKRSEPQQGGGTGQGGSRVEEPVRAVVLRAGPARVLPA